MFLVHLSLMKLFDTSNRLVCLCCLALLITTNTETNWPPARDDLMGHQVSRIVKTVLFSSVQENWPCWTDNKIIALQWSTILDASQAGWSPWTAVEPLQRFCAKAYPSWCLWQWTDIYRQTRLFHMMSLLIFHLSSPLISQG